mgnify:FL=1
MSKFRGLTNLAEQQKPILYQRPEDLFFATSTATGVKNTGEAVILPFKRFDTGSNIVNYPLNERLVLGFRDIEILPNNWDTLGSLAPSASTIALAKRVAGLFPSELQPEILPECSGTIGFYWETTNQEIVLYIDCNRENNSEWEIEDFNKDMSFTPDPANIWAISEAIRKLLLKEF